MAPGDGRDQPLAVAMVSWSERVHLEAHVQVTLLSNRQARFRSYEMHFLDADAEVERLRSVGYAIATLVGEALAAAPPDEPSLPSSLPPRPEGADLPRVRATLGPPSGEDPRRWWFDGQFLAGRGAVGITPSLGGSLGVSFRLGASPWLVTGSLMYALQAQPKYDISVSWTAASLGLGLSTARGAPWGVEFRLEMLGERLDVRGTNPRNGDRESAYTWTGGGRVAISGVWRFSDPVGFVGGFALDEVFSPTVVSAGGEKVSYIPTTDGRLLAGVRVALH